MASMAPHVPGITGRKPTPNEVAINFGKRGNFPASGPLVAAPCVCFMTYDSFLYN